MDTTPLFCGLRDPAKGTCSVSCAERHWFWHDNPADVARYLMAVEAYTRSGSMVHLAFACDYAAPLFAHYEGYYESLRRSELS
jgi:hypothetical protein